MEIIFFLVSFLASVVGSICGIGGGVIIKPVLDLLNMTSVSVISFLSVCTVLSMSLYSIGRSFVAKDSVVDIRTGTPLALGGAVGGIAGSLLFAWLKGQAENPNSVSFVQSLCLALVTLGAIAYTVNKERINTHQIKNALACFFIGLALGTMSSFLGIGGGPMNLVVLYFFFSMDTKKAAQNSLYIILFSQFANLASTILTGQVPEFPLVLLLLMAVGGVLGGVVGRAVNKRMNQRHVSNLFVGLMAVIVLICVFNMIRYC